MDIEIVRPSELSPDDARLWSAFQSGHNDLASPFFAPHWPRFVEAAQTSAASRVRIAVIRDGGKVRGFLPIALRGGVAQAAGAPLCAYQGLIGEPGLVLDTRRLLDALGVPRLDFAHTPHSQTTFAPHLREPKTAWIARLPFGYEVYAADKAYETDMLDGLDRRREEAEKVLFTPVSHSSTDFARLIAWRQQGLTQAGKPDVFAIPWVQTLLRELFAGRDPAFGGALFTLHIDDELAAVQFNLMGAQSIHAWFSAQNPAFERHSPTLLLLQDILKWMDDTAYTAIDFGPAAGAHLRRLANDGCDIGKGFIGRPSGAAMLRQAAQSLPRMAMRRVAGMGGLR